MDLDSKAYSIKYDLNNCENEPVHLIRLIQAHTCLIACNPIDFSIIQVSDNTEAIIGYLPNKLLQFSLLDILPKEIFDRIKEEIIKAGNFKQINPLRANIYYQDYSIYHNLIVHLNPDDLLILEVEPIDNNVTTTAFQYTLSDAIQNIQKASYEELFDQMAQEVKKITGFDRVMVYRFDKDNNGEVIAEAKEDFVEPYLGLKYPASDIPPQARALYLKNKTRILSDVGSTSAQIIPVLAKDANQPLDLTYSVTRGLSPIHLEYLRNMKVRATMSISIILDDRLWGLIACHHFTPKFLDYSIRFTCHFMAQIFSGHLALESANLFRTSVLKTNITRAKLFENMSEDYNIFDGLTAQKETVIDLIDCGGAAVITEHQVSLLGTTPTEEEIIELCKWLDDKTDTPVFDTNSLPKLYEPAKAFKEKAAGIIAIKFALNPSEFIIWFRPEVTQEVYWGGNPNKAMSKNGERISPRKSFQKWKEIVKDLSRQWEKYELNAANALRNDIREFITQRFNEIRQLNKQMEAAYQELEMFSYSVSHDLRSPLRNIDGFTQILKEDYSDKMDDWGTEILNTIMESTNKMNILINDILNFSRLGRKSMEFQSISTQELVDNALKEVLPIHKENLDIILSDALPNLWGDKSLLQQVFINLISNAIKYSHKKNKPLIEIDGKQTADFTFVKIKDNGIGMDMKYANKVFGVFNRLVSEEEYPGTGIGLAIVHRIITRHEGEVSIESKLGKETTLWLKLPKEPVSKTFNA